MIKRILIGLSATALLATPLVVMAAQQRTPVTICHATGSTTNPYNKQTVDDDAVDGVGNGDHNRDGHQNGEDIIPPGSWDADGRNWDAQGQAIYNNDCEVPTPPVNPPTPPVVPPVTETPKVETPTTSSTPVDTTPNVQAEK